MKKSNLECSVAIQVLPWVEDASVFPIVDKVIAYIQSTGLVHVTGPFETTVEGTLDELMDIVKECQKICIASGAPHVLSYIKISYGSANGVWSINDKTEKYNK